MDVPTVGWSRRLLSAGVLLCEVRLALGGPLLMVASV